MAATIAELLGRDADLAGYAGAFERAKITPELAAELGVPELRVLLPDASMGHCLKLHRLLVAARAADGTPAKNGVWFGNPLGDGEASPEHSKRVAELKLAQPPVLDVNSISRDDAQRDLTQRTCAICRRRRVVSRRSDCMCCKSTSAQVVRKLYMELYCSMRSLLVS